MLLYRKNILYFNIFLNSLISIILPDFYFLFLSYVNVKNIV